MNFRHHRVPTSRVKQTGQVTLIGLLALTGLGGTTVAGATPTQADDPAPSAESRIVNVERRTLEVERRVVAFDGRSEQIEGTDVTVSLDADVLFEFDKADLTPAAKDTLTQLATELEDSLAGDEILVVGHTDSKGEDAYNQDLSTRRAQTVRDVLAKALPDAPAFKVEGRGESDPVAENELPDGADNPEGRRRNRRVEITYEAKPPKDG